MKNNKKGFTLVELVIVVAVMAILVAVAIPTIGSISASAKNSVNDTNARTIESVLKLAEANASKTGDGVTALTEQKAFDAIYDAKLGIVSGEFNYNVDTGVVAVGTGTKGAKLFNITFTDSALKVEGSATITARTAG